MIECKENILSSKATISRLPGYLRYLRRLLDAGMENISSTRLAEDLHLNPVQVRKDLAYISPISGKPKLGFSIRELTEAIEEFLGLSNANDAFLIGVGGLGHTLLSYAGFKNYGLNIRAAFDINTKLFGEKVNGVTIFSLDDLRSLASRLNVKLGIITVPSQAAQEVADLLVESGILAIWNFAPIHLKLPNNIVVKNEDLAASLAVLSGQLKDALKDY